jgi:hypothetical protein
MNPMLPGSKVYILLVLGQFLNHPGRISLGYTGMGKTVQIFVTENLRIDC